MSATIKIKNSSTTGAVPTSSDLVQGELAVNVTDLGLYTENASGTVVKLNAPSIDDKNTGATKHLTISTGGNLGLGVTPSATGSSYKSFELGFAGVGLNARSNATLDVDQGVYWTAGSAPLYASTGVAAAHYRLSSGTHVWQTAASGTAGNAITFTQAMTLDASGNLGLGTTSPSARLHVSTSAAGIAEPVWLNNSQAVGAGVGSRLVFTGTTSNNGLAAIDGAFAGSTTADGGYMVFSTRAVTSGTLTERARIDSSGRFGIGGLTPYSGFNMSIPVTPAGNEGIRFQASTTGTSYAMEFYTSDNVSHGYISYTTSGTSYNTTSDYRLKHDIVPMTGALAKVIALKPCTYKWNADGSDGEGFIAHELAEVCPHAVTGEKDAVNEDGAIKPQGIDTSYLVATLTAAIQELNAKFEAYKAAHP